METQANGQSTGSNATVFIAGLKDPVVKRIATWIGGTGLYDLRVLGGVDELPVGLRGVGTGVVVVDATNGRSQEWTAAMRSIPGAMPVLAIAENAQFEVVVGAFRSGAADVVDLPVSELVFLERVARAVREDRTRVAKRTLFWKVNELMNALTPREREVMRCVVDGSANKQIATDLGISEKTVEVHRHKVMRKMEANSLAALVRMTVVMESTGADRSLRL